MKLTPKCSRKRIDEDDRSNLDALLFSQKGPIRLVPVGDFLGVRRLAEVYCESVATIWPRISPLRFSAVWWLRENARESENEVFCICMVVVGQKKKEEFFFYSNSRNTHSACPHQSHPSAAVRGRIGRERSEGPFWAMYCIKKKQVFFCFLQGYARLWLEIGQGLR